MQSILEALEIPYPASVTANKNYSCTANAITVSKTPFYRFYQVDCTIKSSFGKTFIIVLHQIVSIK